MGSEMCIRDRATILKIEVQFDTDGGGPINGVSSGGYGNSMTCMVGLIGYASDQGGNPTAGGTSVTWIAGQVKKASGAQPSGTPNTNLYYSGSKPTTLRAAQTMVTHGKTSRVLHHKPTTQLCFALRRCVRKTVQAEMTFGAGATQQTRRFFRCQSWGKAATTMPPKSVTQQPTLISIFVYGLALTITTMCRGTFGSKRSATCSSQFKTGHH